MGAEQSILQEKGYKLITEAKHSVVVAKGDDEFFIKKISLQKSREAHPELISEIKILKDTSHPHIVSCKESFTGQNTYYVVMEYCKGGSLAEKIKGMSEPPQESEALSWFVEICVALRTVHEKGLLHKHLIPENVLFTEFGTVCLGNFGEIYENSKNDNDSKELGTVHFLAPEVFTKGTYDAKSDIWLMGCLLYELCTQKPAFSAETKIKLMPKIIGGPRPALPDKFSPALRELLHEIFHRDPESRPTASEILEYPVIIDCLSEKCKTTVEELQTKLEDLRKVADGLERVHQGTTVGSLAGGVIGALGGITSVVGLVLAPFTVGASLIVTGVGVGVGALGGVTAGASNITKIINESSDRKNVRGIIKGFQKKIEAVVTWLQEIGKSLQTIKNRFDPADTSEGQNSNLNQEDFIRLGTRAGRGLSGIAELIRLLEVLNIGRVAAQTSRLIRVAEVATGVFVGLFLAIDIFFIAMDAKEIHHIRQAKAAEERGQTSSVSASETETDDFEPTSDKSKLVPSALMQEVPPEQPSQKNPEIRSEIMKFVLSIREAADNLQKVLDDLKSIISSIPSLQNMGTELEFRNMELM